MTYIIIDTVSPEQVMQELEDTTLIKVEQEYNVLDIEGW